MTIALTVVVLEDVAAAADMIPFDVVITPVTVAVVAVENEEAEEEE